MNNPDIDECVNFNGGCEHVCKNSVGSYKCFCYNGHLLEADEHGCKGNDIVIKLSWLCNMLPFECRHQ